MLTNTTIGRVILTWNFIYLLFQCSLNAQVIERDKEAIITNVKMLENLMNNKDTIKISDLIKYGDPLGVRMDGYFTNMTTNYSLMKTEAKVLMYDSLEVTSFSSDGVNNYMHVFVPSDYVHCSIYLEYRIVSENSIELWNFSFSYEKEEDVIPVPSFP